MQTNLCIKYFAYLYIYRYKQGEKKSDKEVRIPKEKDWGSRWGWWWGWTAVSPYLISACE